MSELAVASLCKSFRGIRAVDDVSFSVGQGEFLALIGPNGAGKSTCFNSINGQIAPDSGTIRFHGHDIAGLPPREICRRGAFVGFDRQGSPRDAPVVPLVKALIDAGFVDHILISGDASRGYARPITVFAPKLKAAGVDDATLQRITVDNPRRFLAFVPKRPREAAG